MNYTINRKSTPVFAPQEPSFMGGAFNDEETDQKVKSQATRLCEEIGGKPKSLLTKSANIYLHNTIQDLCEFDIPVFINGIIPDFEFGDIVECLVYDVNDIVHDCFIVVGKCALTTSRLYALIVLKEDLVKLKDGEYCPLESDFSFLNNQ
tara:strand:- start:36 stop:485 length:450 start_codon:yes stop_codon:yes gene_type:complete